MNHSKVGSLGAVARILIVVGSSSSTISLSHELIEAPLYQLEIPALSTDPSTPRLRAISNCLDAGQYTLSQLSVDQKALSSADLFNVQRNLAAFLRSQDKIGAPVLRLDTPNSPRTSVDGRGRIRFPVPIELQGDLMPHSAQTGSFPVPGLSIVIEHTPKSERIRLVRP